MLQNPTLSRSSPSRLKIPSGLIRSHWLARMPVAVSRSPPTVTRMRSSISPIHRPPCQRGRSFHRGSLHRRVELLDSRSKPSNRLPLRLVNPLPGPRFGQSNEASFKKHRLPPRKKHRLAVRAGLSPLLSCLLRELHRWRIPCIVKPPRVLNRQRGLQALVLRPRQRSKRLCRSSSRNRAESSTHPVCFLAASTSPCRSRTIPRSKY